MTSQHRVFCIGPSSISFGLALNQISKELQFPPLELLCFDDNNNINHPTSIIKDVPVPSSINDDNNSFLFRRFNISRCCHHYLNPAAYTCSPCQERPKLLLEWCQSFLDSVESCSMITIVAEVHSPMSVWVYQQLISAFRSIKVDSRIETVLLKPPINLCGIENSYAVLLTSLALESSCAIYIRGIDEYLVEVEGEVTKQSVDGDEIGYLIACDLWPIFVPNNAVCYDEGQYILWPHHFVTTQCKVIDVRSTLFRTITSLKKSERSRHGDLKHSQILSSTVHHLHRAYISNGWSSPTKTMGKYNLASKIEVILDRKNKKLRFVDRLNSSHENFTSLLEWATPSIQWVLLEESSNFQSYFNSATVASSANASSEIKIAVITFDSPYGMQDLQLFCDKARNILYNGAYRHIFQEASLMSIGHISNSISAIESYLYQEICNC